MNAEVKTTAFQFIVSRSSFIVYLTLVSLSFATKPVECPCRNLKPDAHALLILTTKVFVEANPWLANFLSLNFLTRPTAFPAVDFELSLVTEQDLGASTETSSRSSKPCGRALPARALGRAFANGRAAACDEHDG